MIDRDMVDELVSVLGEGTQRLISSFESDAEQKLDQLRQAQAKGDNETVRQLLHSLRGSSGNLGLEAVALLCGQYEQQLPVSEHDLLRLQEAIVIGISAFRRHLRSSAM